ncbi:hypothetical protein Sjap_011727 [Stephania japonica]|uniref:DUF3511 domain-containing protein n=1 Tax=Stephania japonica TaxID=461633 RepID=A0AAP0JCX1_9MAGN
MGHGVPSGRGIKPSLAVPQFSKKSTTKHTSPAFPLLLLPPHLITFFNTKSLMEDFRSKSCGDGRTTTTQIESYYGGNNNNKPTSSGMQDLRCYSASYTTSSVSHTHMSNNNKDVKFKTSKNGSSSKSWSFNDPELQRKKRVASYKVYAVEGKMKGSFRKSFRWLKDRYSQVVYGWW